MRDGPRGKIPGSIPGYWMYETSGVLRPAIEAFLYHREMTGEDIAAMRAYLRQWIFADVWLDAPGGAVASLRERIDELTTREAIDRWLDDAAAVEIDPL